MSGATVPVARSRTVPVLAGSLTSAESLDHAGLGYARTLSPLTLRAPSILEAMFTEATRRFQAWWDGEGLDRPLLTLRAKRGEPEPRPDARFIDRHETWFDVDHQLDAFVADLACYRPLGDAVPVFFPNLGPDLLATLFGCELEFGDDTSWSLPVGEAAADVLRHEATFDGLYWRTIERMTQASLDRAQGRWWTAFADLHPNADLVAAMIGPENLAFECSDNPEDVRAAVEHVTPTCIEAYDRLHRLIHATGQPMLTWLEAPYPGRMYAACCDFNALVSPNDFEELILPSVREESRAMDRVIFHLDGPAALRHLDAILASPEFHAVQWVFGAGQGPARRWSETYRRILDAGKRIEVICDDLEDAVWAAREFGSSGVWIHVPDSLPLDRAEALVSEILG